MPAQELINYIQTNVAAGFSRPDIEQLLIKTGWAAADIAQAFSVVTQKKNETPSVPLPHVSNQQSDTIAEVDRIQEELKQEEIRRKRLFTNRNQTQTSSGMTGWLQSKGIVQSEGQANFIFICIIIVTTAASVWILFFKSVTKGPTQQEINASVQAMQNAKI